MKKECGDKHKLHRRAVVKLSDAALAKLHRFLPEQEGVEGKIRFLLSVMVELAPRQTFRVFPAVKPTGRTFWVRLPEKVYSSLERYAQDGNLNTGQQASNLLNAGLELLERGGALSLPLGKEALKRQIEASLEKRGRVEYLRKGLSLIWRSIWR